MTSLLVMEMSETLPDAQRKKHTHTHTGLDVIANGMNLLGKNANFNIIGGHIK